MLNNHSTGTDDAGIPKTLTATRVMFVYLLRFLFHCAYKHFFMKCLSTSTSTNASRQQMLESTSKHFKISA